MTGVRAGAAPGHLVGAAAAAVALVLLAALVASGSVVVHAVDGEARALADRAAGADGLLWLTTGRWPDLVGSILSGAGLVTVLGVLLRRRRFGAALWVLASMTAQIAVETLLERLVGRPAPVPAEGTPSDPGFSFPSGHTASATLVLLVLLVVLRAGTPTWWWCLGTGPLLVAAIGMSRVLSFAHHASDVVGGVLLGLVVGLAVAWRIDARPPGIHEKEE